MYKTYTTLLLLSQCSNYGPMGDKPLALQKPG